MAHMGYPEPMMDQQEPANLAKRTMIPFEHPHCIWVLGQVPDFLMYQSADSVCQQ